MRPYIRLILAAALLPAAAGAQVQQRAWDFCFTSGILSCARFDLTTTATFTQPGVRDGTFIDLVVRVDRGAAAAVGLSSIGFDYFSPAGAPQYAEATGVDPTNGWSMTPEALGGAPDAPVAFRWAGAGTSSTTSPFGSGFFVQNTEYDESLPGFGIGTQFIGGCGLAPFGMIDDAYRTPLDTCAPGAAYRLAFGTRASLDASLFRAVNAAFRARLPNATAGVDAGCTAYTDGAPSVGTDGTLDASGQATVGDVCRVTASPPSSTVPEPATATLVALGGALLLVATRRASAPRVG